MSCIACRQGFTWECRKHGNCDDATDNTSVSVPDTPDDSEEDNNEQYIVKTQDDSKLKDQQSTGRKRAAKMYPLAEGAPCEWQGKKNCGGGSNPITGCYSGTQQARHHGPDKNTLNNEKGNVHRICHNCHNRWHTDNDAGYIWGSNYPLHNPVAATNAELANNELSWMNRDIKPVKD